MQTLCVIGLMWGDEGKGKITDFLLQNAQVGVRSQGGNNAGHTIVKNNQKYKLSLLPSSVLKPEAHSFLTNGMVIDIDSLMNEINNLKANNIEIKNLYISHQAHIVFPYHIQLDELYEEIKKDNAVATTKKGIGPCYEDKYSRNGIRIEDLFDDASLLIKLKINLEIKNLLFAKYNKKIFQLDELLKLTHKWASFVKPYVVNTSYLLNKLIDENKKVLFEAAQGSMLCVDHGTYPFVTSSSPTPNAISLNAGIPFQKINKVLGVTKAYTTRVGNGPFPTLFENEISHQIRTKGNEFGTVTGRPRKIGWLDLVIIKNNKNLYKIDSIALMLVDVLSGQKTIKVCTHYLLNDKKIEYIPISSELKNVKPVYQELAGWEEDITNIEKFDDLPINCQKFILFIENEIKIKISYISVGPDQKQTIIKESIW